MSTLQIQGQAVAKPSSDALAEALRKDDVSDFEAISNFAACLLPLLSALGWERNISSLMRALPHVASRMDLIDVRNILAELGFRSIRRRGKASEIDARLMPCLFLPETGEAPLVLFQGDKKVVEAFDSETRTTSHFRAKTLVGYYYIFEAEDDQLTDGSEAKNSWIGNILRRFGREAGLIGLASVLSSFFGLVVPIFVISVYDKVIPSSSAENLYMILPGVAIALLMDLVLKRIRGQAVAHIAGRIDYLLSTELLRKILNLPMAASESSTVDQQMSKFRSFQGLRDIVNSPIATLILDIPLIVMSMVVIFIVGGSLVAIPMIGLLTFGLLAWAYVPAIKRAESAASDARAQRDHLMTEIVSKQRMIRASSLEGAFFERVRPLSARTSVERSKASMLTLSLQSLCHGVLIATGLMTLLFGSQGVLDQTMTTGALVASMALVWRSLVPVQLGFQAMPRIAQLRSTMGQVDRLMRATPEADNNDSRVNAHRFRGPISVKRISVRYRDDADPALLAVSLDVEPGELIAITGASGAGKSTLLKVISGLLKPQAGAIFFGGVEQRHLEPKEQRRHIGYLAQTCDLFHGTVAQNLRLARPDATDQELNIVADAVGVLDEIEALPEGFDTRIGDEKIGSLPESFQQKLSLCRLWLKDAPIMLLDEPTQNLDDLGTDRLNQRLMAMKGHRTVFIVTHRPSAMRMADRVFEVDGGRLTEKKMEPPASGPTQTPRVQAAAGSD